MEKLLIVSTEDQIEKVLKKLLEKHFDSKPKSDFETEKMTVSEACRYINVSYPTLCKWINQSKIPVHGSGRKRFVLKSELEESYKKL